MKREKNISIEKIMHERVITVDIHDTARRCAEKMTEERIGCIIVVEKGAPAGIITERGFADLVKQGNFDGDIIEARHFMTQPLITIERSARYDDALELFNKENVKRVPVVENGEIIGLLTLKNMVEYSRLTIDTLDEENQFLKQEVHRDPLTGLLNRSALTELLEKECTRLKLLGGSSSILFLDIDHFKYINDTYSHMAGDAVLKEMSDVLRNFCREYDHIGRFGGEEFVLVVRNQKKQHALQFAERLREVIESHPFVFKKHSISVTVSIGVSALFSGREYATALERADKAMYYAKSNGRNRVGFYSGAKIKLFEP